MSRFVLAAAGLLLPFAISTAMPAVAQTAARNYDCSKAGNANKTVCKTAAAAPKPAATRNYDCSKPGNANKTVCKTAAAGAPVPAAATTTTATRHYDCTKAGNANKTACKSVATAPAPAPAQRPAPTAIARPAPATPASHAPVAGQNTNAGGPNGATAKCRDGTMSMSAHRSGTCSRHGGVAQWY